MLPAGGRPVYVCSRRGLLQRSADGRARGHGAEAHLCSSKMWRASIELILGGGCLGLHRPLASSRGVAGGGSSEALP
jgi:hypothetical protein